MVDVAKFPLKKPLPTSWETLLNYISFEVVYLFLKLDPVYFLLIYYLYSVILFSVKIVSREALLKISSIF